MLSPISAAFRQLSPMRYLRLQFSSDSDRKSDIPIIVQYHRFTSRNCYIIVSLASFLEFCRRQNHKYRVGDNWPDGIVCRRKRGGKKQSERSIQPDGYLFFFFPSRCLGLGFFRIHRQFSPQCAKKIADKSHYPGNGPRVREASAFTRPER